MATLVFIVAESGKGKSTSLRNLDENQTFIINSDQKVLPFKGAKNKYTVEKKNYLQSSNLDEVITAMKAVNKDTRIKTMVIDTFTRMGTDFIMSDKFRSSTGFSKWGDLAGGMYDIINVINERMREDLIVYLFCHPIVVHDDSGFPSMKIVTQGKQMDKFTLESFSSIVLYAQIQRAPGQEPKYVFSAENVNNTAKAPMGLLEDSNEILNDLVLLNEKIREYFEI